MQFQGFKGQPRILETAGCGGGKGVHKDTLLSVLSIEDSSTMKKIRCLTGFNYSAVGISILVL